MPKYIEVVPPPIIVDIDYYDPNRGHIAVAPGSFHDDDQVVGTILVGEKKEQQYVRIGDAIVTYPGPVYFIRKGTDIPAFYRLATELEIRKDAAGALAPSNPGSEPVKLEE